MVGIYPDDKLLMYVYEYFNIHSLKNLFNYTTQIFLIYKLYIHLVLFFVASMLLKYTQSLKRISELSVINANQELDLLKSQIHPHFLFNTLNNLYRLVMDNEKAGEVVLKLSETLRFNLYEANKKAIPIKMEIKFLKNYIELEKINHGSKVDIRYDFRQIENIESFIAPMILFSFVDHVLKYGVNKSIDNSLVQIKLKQSKQSLFFQITNCVPITPNNLSLHELGISNIKKRLDILYPDKYKLLINEDKVNYKVNLTINLY
ncbi:histidine kinase [Litoribacter alkaliphilus]|uniref:Histidine kinase n=1 Tax=Litoribacter ruber TaxID=702568 RepID=A0AAP2CGD6_9BACT|nr:histidine kinase [Litoribacter alkaliphilus]MBS9523592.1 histidine kinase [Litoribacter alkaliphilus]